MKTGDVVVVTGPPKESVDTRRRKKFVDACPDGSTLI